LDRDRFDGADPVGIDCIFTGFDARVEPQQLVAARCKLADTLVAFVGEAIAIDLATLGEATAFTNTATTVDVGLEVILGSIYTRRSDAGPVARICFVLVTVVAFLRTLAEVVDKPVAAGRREAGARTVAVVIVFGPCITLFAGDFLDKPIATNGLGTRCGARIGVVLVAVITRFTFVDDTVAAAGERALCCTAIAILGVAIVAAFTRAEDTVAAGCEGTVGFTSPGVVIVLAVVTLLTRTEDAVATDP